MSNYVYIVEDDENIQKLLSVALKTINCETKTFDNGEDMLSECKIQIPDLIFLDIMLPGADGFEILKLLKRNDNYQKIPVIILTAKSDETNTVVGLEGGAEDYLTKPFSVLELLARTKKILARTLDNINKNIIDFKDIKINKDMFEVYKASKQLDLTMKEFQLLNMLIENQGRVVLRNELLDKIWGIDFEGETRTLDMHIKTLRAKLNDDAENPIYIKTVRGAGYTMMQ